MNYEQWDAMIATGTPAQVRVGSILRGGHVVGDKFCFTSSRYEIVDLDSVRELQYRNSEGKYD